MKKKFFHLLNLTILNSHILLKFCGSKASHRLQTDNCDEYGRTCWTAAMHPKNCRYAISFCDKIGCPEESSHQHLPIITATRMDGVVCHARTKKRNCIQSAKSVMLGCASQDVSKTVTQRHISRYTVTTMGYTRRFTMYIKHLLIRYVKFLYQVPSLLQCIMYFLSQLCCFILALNI